MYLPEHWGALFGGIFTGASAWAIIGHAVQTFPVPQSKYGQWFLGAIQYAVGQRERAANTVTGAGTLTSPIGERS
jgi:hypothetical protein